MKKLNKHIKTPIKKRKNAGFTLLELVVVVAVMGLISSMAMDVYTDNTNQKRFELTKQRLAEIKFAIIGDSSRDLITGYVVDVGELPLSIDELLYQCVTNSASPVGVEEYNELNCGTNKWIENWKGPYLRNRQTNSDGYFVFKDGWGNNFRFSSDGKTVITYSEGLDRARNPNNTADYNKQSIYERDYPRSLNSNPDSDPAPLITQSEFEDTLIKGGIVYANVTIRNTSMTTDINDEDMCLIVRKVGTSSNYYSSKIKKVTLEKNSEDKFNFGLLDNSDSNSIEKYLRKELNTIGEYNFEINSTCAPTIGLGTAAISEILVNRMKAMEFTNVVL